MKIRTICINDRVDSGEPVDIWRPRLTDATRTHTQTNWYTSHRIKRQLEHLWTIGAAIGAVRSGYRRRPTIPATEKEAAKGPFFDEIDEKWDAEIRAAYEQIALNDPPWEVARYLTDKNVPKTSNASLPEWADNTVKSLIRETIYRGWDEYRVTHATPQLGTGKKKAERSEASQVLSREMPHLRIVSDELWYQANAAIDGRRPDREFPSGPDHPQFGIPRDSRSLLSTIFRMLVLAADQCKEVPVMGMATSAVRPTIANAGTETAEYELIENAAKQIVREQLCMVDQVVDEFLGRLTQLIGDRDKLHRRLARLTKKRKETNLRIERLIKFIEGRKTPSEKILRRIELLEGLLRTIAAKRNQLRRLLSGEMIPTREDILKRLQAVAANLDADKKTSRRGAAEGDSRN